ncbi:uncharacterized protein LOC114785171 [Denticeps clupeoides]|uniref:AIG1-type G domain-containing protein n=1 Tax=Denticeps clupeoides TaxID=299321 RepID=A0AAY3ZVI4_9TELE|nr:uncharacterized protein LOC114785171 [Denticeps clupeoides]
MDSVAKRGGGSPDLRLILLGNIDCGKTMTADNLLEQQGSSLGSSRSTRLCHLRRGVSHSRWLTVVEAPRWYWSGGQIEAGVRAETQRALALTDPGPHAFLLLIPVGQFTEVEQLVPQEMEAIFGPGVLHHTMVVLTCGDYLISRSAEEYLRQDDQGLCRVVERCGGRYHVINNRRPNDMQQVLQLLEKVERMVHDRGGCYIRGSLLGQDARRNKMGSPAEDVVEMRHSPGIETQWSGQRTTEKYREAIESAEKERREKEKTELEKAEKERREQERLEMESRERTRWDIERREKERAEMKRKEKESAELERREKERAEMERREKERAEMEREGKERAEIERREKERPEMERRENERAEMERREKERAEIIDNRPLSVTETVQMTPETSTETFWGEERWMNRCRTARERREKEREERNKEQCPAQTAEETVAVSHMVNGLNAEVLPRQQNTEDKHVKRSSANMNGSSVSSPDISSGFSTSAPDMDLRLVLLGSSGSGKSTAGNIILGQEVFESHPHSTGIVTQHCKKGRGIIANRQVAVVDTPDWSRLQRSLEVVRAELSSCIALSTPGPHAFLLCVPVYQHTHPELQTLERVFGREAVSRYTVVLFTHTDKLGQVEVEDYIASERPDLLELVERCGDRYHVLQRGSGGALEKRNVAELLGKVEQMVKESGDVHYSCPLYQETQSSIRQRKTEAVMETTERRKAGQEDVDSPTGPGKLASLKEAVEEEEEEIKNMKAEPVPAPSLLRSLGAKVGGGVHKVPKLLAGGVLLGGVLGAFFWGGLGLALGATAGAAVTEAARWKLGKQKSTVD